MWYRQLECRCWIFHSVFVFATYMTNGLSDRQSSVASDQESRIGTVCYECSGNNESVWSRTTAELIKQVTVHSFAFSAHKVADGATHGLTMLGSCVELFMNCNFSERAIVCLLRELKENADRPYKLCRPLPASTLRYFVEGLSLHNFIHCWYGLLSRWIFSPINSHFYSIGRNCQKMSQLPRTHASMSD